MIVLSIDPGTRFLGYAIITDRKSPLSLDHGCLVLKPSHSLPDRLYRIFLFLKEQIEKYKVTYLALETPFLGKNAQTFLKLGYVRGIVYLLAAKYNLPIAEYSPRSIKQSITGNGASTKEQVGRAAKIFLKIKDTTLSTDTTDALAIGLCALWMR